MNDNARPAPANDAAGNAEAPSNGEVSVSPTEKQTPGTGATEAPVQPDTKVDTAVTPKAEKPSAPQPAAPKPPDAKIPDPVPGKPSDQGSQPEKAEKPVAPKAAASPTPVVVTETEFGYIDSNGVVWVRDGEETREVGSYPEGVPEDPFALYVRRYLDLEATLNLFEARLPTLPAKDIDATIRTLREQLKAPAVVGNIPGLRAHLDRLVEESKERKNQLRLERQEARDQALAARTAVVEQAEEVAAQPAERTQWKQSGQRLRDLLEEWRGLQRKGPRLDKSTEDALWKRFSQARTTFDRGRRQYFSALDEQQAEAKAVKERLIVEAESLQNSDDWRTTSAAYRDLMEQWKRAGRASRREDDELWARFRAAQQVFFDSRRAHDRQVDEAFGENLKQKEALAEQAEALLPVEDLDVTRTKLRAIQDQWDEVGQVPSRDVSRVEGRLKAVERALREAENREWRRSDPETQARASGMLSQLEASIADLEKKLAKAEAAGDTKRVKEVSDALATKKMWFDQISSSIA